MISLPSNTASDFQRCGVNHHDIEGMNKRLSQVLNIKEHCDVGRGEIERFIQQCFSTAYGASVRHFMPRLLSLRSRHNELIAAFGLRAAVEERLFLESYLDQPVEEVLQNHTGLTICRRDIVEVGNLSALYPGAARWLIVAVTARLYSEGYTWVVFTGTPALRNGFHRLGLRPVELGLASPDRLPAQERADWGNYYDHAPMVMAGDIAHGYRSLLMQRDLTQLLRAGVDCVETGHRACV